MAAVTVGTRVDRLSGMYDGSLLALNPNFLAEYYSECYLARQSDSSVNAVPRVAERRPDRAIEHATVRTQYISVYRIHSKERFHFGSDFPRNWAESEDKKEAPERFSPAGTLGYFCGLTLDAALDEGCYYGGGSIDGEQRMILVLECCFDNLLYLTVQGALQAAWESAGLEPTGPMEMYLAIMGTETGNTEADAIGTWARRRGFDGLIFPSARYGEREALERARAAGLEPIPVINTVFLGSHLCIQGLATMQFKAALIGYLTQAGRGKRFHPVYAEPNLVLFDGRQIGGEDRAVFYQTFPLEQASEVEDLDSRLQSKSYTHFVREGEVTIIEEGPGYTSITF